MTSLEGWSAKAKEAPSPHDVRLTLQEHHPSISYFSDIEILSFEISRLLEHASARPKSDIDTFKIIKKYKVLEPHTY